MQFRKDLTKLKKKHRAKQMLFSLSLLLMVLLLSCQSFPRSPKIEYVAITSDLDFPTVPDVQKNNVRDLTQEEYLLLVDYIIKAEKVFDIIAAREEVLANTDSLTGD